MNVTIAILGSSFLAAAITAVIAFFANRRKLSAEATKIITEAASGVVERLEKENERQAGRIESQGKDIEVLQQKERNCEEEIRKLRRQLVAVVQTVQLHAAYDSIVRTKYENGDTDPLPPTPPLLPPDFPMSDI